MPLVSGTTWFDTDPGDSRAVLPRHPPAERNSDPTAATLIPGPLPSGALAWHIEQRGRRQPRPWQPTAEHPTGAWPTLTSVAQTLAWYRPPEARQVRPQARLTTEPLSLLPVPPDAPTLAWQAPCELLLASRRILPRDPLSLPWTPALIGADQLLAWLARVDSLARVRPRTALAGTETPWLSRPPDLPGFGWWAVGELTLPVPVPRLQGAPPWQARPPDLPGFGWHVVAEVLCRGRASQRHPEQVLPLWTVGTMGALAWHVAGEVLLRRGPVRTGVEQVHVPLLAVTDIPVTLLAPLLAGGEVRRPGARTSQSHEGQAVPLWTVGTMGYLAWAGVEHPWARRVWRPAGESSTAPLAPPANDQPALIGWQTAADLLRRVAVTRATEAGTLQPAWLLELPRWQAALATPERARWPAARFPAEAGVAASLLWEGAAVALDQLGRAWIAVPEMLLRTRRQAVAEAAPLVLGGPLAMAMPWIPHQGGDWPRLRGGNGRPWQPAAPDAWAPWIAAGLILVAGPYYLVGGQLYSAGAVEGDVRTVQ